MHVTMLLDHPFWHALGMALDDSSTFWARVLDCVNGRHIQYASYK